jgi:hypothetical protein
MDNALKRDLTAALRRIPAVAELICKDEDPMLWSE